MSKTILSLDKKTKNLSKQFSGYNLSQFKKNEKITNFSPGPSQIPPLVLEEIKNNIFSQESIYPYGITPFEISHRSPEFSKILENTNNNMKKLMNISDEFSILWTQGGGNGQFSAIPLNLLDSNINSKKGNYLVTGTWSNRAFKEASQFANVYNSYENINKSLIPLQYKDILEDPIINDDEYVYLCSNETVNGIEFRKDGLKYPSRKQLKGAKLIVDMSSDFCMKNIDWNNIDVAFACTSKNLGISGANITIIRKELLNNKNKKIPSILNWDLYHNTNSGYNTPAIFNIYLIDIIVKYYIEIGGIDEIEKMSKIKSEIIYNTLDKSRLFSPIVNNKKIRSNINIPFIVGNGNNEIKSQFLDYCYQNNIVGLRTMTPFKYEDFNMIEPLRISLYNGVSIQETEKFSQILNEFEHIIYISEI